MGESKRTQQKMKRSKSLLGEWKKGFTGTVKRYYLERLKAKGKRPEDLIDEL